MQVCCSSRNKVDCYARAATRIALAGVYLPALKLVSTWFANERRLALGVVIGALTLGSASPHLVRALSGSLDWRVVVVTATVSTLAGALTILLYAREGHWSSKAQHVPH